MSNLSKDECERVQRAVTSFCQIVMLSDWDLVERYLDQTRAQADGTMDVILPHFMSIPDMLKGQENLRFIRSILTKMKAVRAIVDNRVQHEQSARTSTYEMDARA